MSIIDKTNGLNDLVMKPVAEYERLARIRERQRRKRKEKLYSYHDKIIDPLHTRNTST